MNGKNGENGADGKDGEKGADGRSVQLRATETEVQWRQIDSDENDVMMWTYLFSLADLKGADGETPNLSGYTTTEQFSILESNIQQLSDSTKYDLQNANDRILSLENQVQGLLSTIEKSNGFTTIFNYGSSVIDNYGEKIYTYYNDGYRSLSGFVQSYPNFCSAENEYALSFNQTDFSWARTVFVLFLESVKITSASQLVLTYSSGATANAEMYFVPKFDATGADLAQHIYETIQSCDAISVSCKWLYTDDFITVLQSLESVTNGEYYFAFKGISDNSHPIIRSIKILEG